MEIVYGIGLFLGGTAVSLLVVPWVMPLVGRYFDFVADRMERKR